MLLVVAVVVVVIVVVVGVVVSVMVVVVVVVGGEQAILVAISLNPTPSAKLSSDKRVKYSLIGSDATMFN